MRTVVPWITNLAERPDCHFKVTRSPLIATFNYPGFNSSCFDKNGCLDIARLVSYADDALSFVQNYPAKSEDQNFIDWLELKKSHLMFISSLEITMSRNIYSIYAQKCDLETKASLGFIGNATIVFSLEFYVPGSKEPVLTQVYQQVGVDKETRKPLPLPEWFRNKYRHQTSRSAGFRLTSFHRPERTFVCKRKVMWSETDNNSHTNFASYIKYAVDAIHASLHMQAKEESSKPATSNLCPGDPINDSSRSRNTQTKTTASSAEKDSTSQNNLEKSMPLSAALTPSPYTDSALPGLSDDILKQGVKSLQVCYVSESHEGDVLDVHVWQEGEEVKVKCSVEKEGKVVCQLVLEYFSLPSKL